MGELLLGQPKGGRGCFIEVLFPILFYNNIYFGTLITGCLIEDGQLIGDCLMEARLYT